MRKLLKNFLRCGTLGWCLEITFTALHSLRKRDMTLKGTTSLWMFPIYGCGCLLAPLFRLLRTLPGILRGSVYAGLILTGEYLSGSLLKRKGMCPWDYGKSRWNVGRIIRLDYFPCWIATGLLMESALSQKRTEDAG